MISFFKTIKHNIKAAFGWFKVLSLKKKLFFTILVVVGVGLIIFRISELYKPAPYTLQKASKSDITEFVSETGNITSGGSANVYSPTNGVVDNVFVSNGDTVEKDQDLFSVKSSATEQEQQAAYSSYLSASALLNAANSTQDTLRAEMFTKWKTFLDLATNSTYENSDKSPNTGNRTAAEFNIAKNYWYAAEKKAKDQQTAIAQAQAQVASTWLLYQATQNSTVKAPMKGIISNLSVTIGSPVSISTALLPQSPVLVISNGSINEAVIALGETDIAKVKPMQNVQINVDAAGNKDYKGLVARVDNIGVKNQGVVTYNVYLKISDPDENLRPGMSIDAKITTKQLSNVLSVSNSAIKPYQGGKAVRIPGVKKGDIKYIPVIIGVKGKEKTQILKGVYEGQDVVTSLANEQVKRPGLFGN